jgi:hypothetical protein
MRRAFAIALGLVLWGCASIPKNQESYDATAALRAYNDFLARTVVRFESLRSEQERKDFAARLKSELEAETLRYQKHVDGEKARGTLLQASRTAEFQSEVHRLQHLANKVGLILDKYLYGKTNVP